MPFATAWTRRGLPLEALDYVGFYDQPFLKLERLLETYLSYAPRGFRSFLQFVPSLAKQKLHLPREIGRGLAGYRRQIVFTEHHESHAASAFFPSPFDEAAILTLDGVGEWANDDLRGRPRQSHRADPRDPLSAFARPAVLGVHLLHRLQGQFAGEYKLMGLAPYGEPVVPPTSFSTNC